MIAAIKSSAMGDVTGISSDEKGIFYGHFRYVCVVPIVFVLLIRPCYASEESGLEH
jgi:hypothetical protein